MMSRLRKALESGEFAVTAELAPPKGTIFPTHCNVQSYSVTGLMP